MNTITGPSPLLPGQLPAIAPLSTQQTAPEQTTTTSTTTLPPATYQALAFARATIETLGLDLPRTPEDSLAILSAVQQALDKTVDETRNNRAQALASSLRSAVTGWAGMVGQMDTLHAQYVQQEAERDAKKADREEKIADRTAKIALKETIQTQIDAKNTQINNLNGQINTLNGQIGTLNGQIGTLNGEINALNVLISATPAGAVRDALIGQRDAKVNDRNGKQSDVNNKTTERNNAQSTLATVTSERNSLVAQKATLETEIAQLTTDIDRLAGEITALEGQMDATATEYFQTKDSILVVFAPLSLALQSVATSALQAASASDAIFNRLFENLAEQALEYNGLNRIREASEGLLEQLGTLDAQSRVLGAAAGLLAGLVDVLSTLSNLGDALQADQPPGLQQLNGRLQIAS